MNTLAIERREATAESVTVTNDTLTIHLLDEDISVENLLFGSPSGESQESFKRWLAHGKVQPRSSSRRPNQGIQSTRRQKR